MTDLHQDMRDVVNGIERPQDHITTRVERILRPFDNNWRTTADLCVLRAQELEAAAADLRDRAEKLMAARVLVDEVKGAVQFEIDARQRADSLLLVQPSKH